jgi:hypothetical protein
MNKIYMVERCNEEAGQVEYTLTVGYTFEKLTIWTRGKKID